MVFRPPHAATLERGATPHNDFAISKSFSEREVHLLYSGAISAPGIKSLTEHVETAVVLYQPEQVTVHMRSPGGLMAPLYFWVDQLNDWGQLGLNIATEAGTECASAAAMIVALGALGQRTAHPLAQLLFHNPRLVSREFTLLEHDAEEAARTLKESRARMHAMLNRHLVDGLGRLGFARTLCARAAWLQSRPESEPNRFQNYNVRQDASASQLPPLETWAQSRPGNLDEADSLIAQWTDQLEILFRRDQVFDLRIAWALLLIDESGDLPPLIEDDAAPELEKRDWQLVPVPAQAHKPVQPSTV